MSMKHVALLAMAEMLGAMHDMPGGKKQPYVRTCLECGNDINTDQISPFCSDDCRIKHAEKNKSQSIYRKEKKHKPWKRK